MRLSPRPSLPGETSSSETTTSTPPTSDAGIMVTEDTYPKYKSDTIMELDGREIEAGAVLEMWVEQHLYGVTKNKFIFNKWAIKPKDSEGKKGSITVREISGSQRLITIDELIQNQAIFYPHGSSPSSLTPTPRFAAETAQRDLSGSSSSDDEFIPHDPPLAI